MTDIPRPAFYEAEPQLNLGWGQVERSLENIGASDWVEDFSVFPEMYVGQEVQQEALASFLTDATNGDVLLIQGRFGSGKTVMRNVVESRLGIEHHQELLLFANGLDWRIEEVSLQGLANQASGGRTTTHMAEDTRYVVVEEVGRVRDEARIQEMLSTLKQLRETGQLPPLIITGEETFDDPRFFEALGLQPGEAKRIVMDPLTPDLLVAAISQRLGHNARLTTLDEITSKARDVPVQNTIEQLQQWQAQAEIPVDASSLFDQEFLEVMLLPMDVPAANLRDVKGLLQSIAASNANQQGSARFNGEAYKHFKELPRVVHTSFTPAQIGCIEWVQKRIRECREQGGVFQGLNARDIMMGVLGNTHDIDNYTKRVISKVAPALLMPIETSDFMNDDYREDTFSQNVRYVPTPRMALDAVYDPIERIAPDKAGLEKVIANATNQDMPAKDRADSLLSSYFAGLIDEQGYRVAWLALVKSTMAQPNTDASTQ